MLPNSQTQFPSSQPQQETTITQPPPLNPSWLWRIRKLLQGGNHQPLTREEVPHCNLSGKWILITGSNNGIGRSAAHFFAECGANLVLACRPNPPPHETRPEKVMAECKARGPETAAEDQSIEIWDVDSSQLSSVVALAERWRATGRGLDVLCNNAGISSSFYADVAPSASEEGKEAEGAWMRRTEDGFELVHQINFLAHCLLTFLLLPSLAQTADPRIVCTTSNLQFFASVDALEHFDSRGLRSGDSLYGNNKLFLQVWISELQNRLDRAEEEGYRRIRIDGVHPGTADTGIWHRQDTAGEDSGVSGWLRRLPDRAFKWLASFSIISPGQGAYAIVNAVIKAREEFGEGRAEGVGGGGGKYFNRIWETEPMPHCSDPRTREFVWRKTLEELRAYDQDLVSRFPSFVRRS
ncbi:hypothetical protein D0869_03844 [Hortaea werneckii]|uniref:Ketoreductase (KR) domain-containing protein n=1 Tax=Hortaea werneckii TaxID=91943 RepID=A0A3M7ATX3_HORWE|nr:hypothetical protein KC334_g10349 [Hortaea werneckii]KAI6994214.1 hypothetical protein KC355_g10280 [Hortaea werneckii]KAI7185593.1 hypothetical protein KC324_g7376 [Hortaea werneckii]KAI7579986.1 hypothetical protein KC316_g9204 [Hortaea werneckii]KAI7660123.1 hypothetical protein KC318_g10281 [Hortaea werneckii]